MNNDRRARIKDLIGQLEGFKNEAEDILSEEQDYYDNIPENLQMSVRAETAEAAISNLEDAISAMDDAISSLEGAGV